MSQKIYFILSGIVDVFHMDSKDSLVHFKEGSYFGEVSYIFKVRNKYSFIPRPKTKYQIFSLKSKAIDEMFDNYPDFKSLLQIRGLRRHLYLRKLKR